MKMKRILTIINYIGDVLIGVAFVWSLIVTHSLRSFNYQPTRYCLGFGLLLLIPYGFYKMWHWTEYEKENKQTLIFMTILIAVMILAFTIMGVR